MIDNQFLSALRSRAHVPFASLTGKRVVAVAAAATAVAVLVGWPQQDAAMPEMAGAEMPMDSPASPDGEIASERGAKGLLAGLFGPDDLRLTDPEELEVFGGYGDGIVTMNGANMMTMGNLDQSGPSGQAKLLGAASLLTILLSWRVLRRTRQSRARFGSRRFSPETDRMLRIMCHVSPSRDEANIGRITALIHALTGDTVSEQYVVDLLEVYSEEQETPDIVELAAEISPENSRLAMSGALMVAWRRGKFSAQALAAIGRLACILRLNEDDVVDLFSSMPDPSDMLARS